MKAFYRGNITDKNISLPILGNRAFLYGDGLFETMLAYNGQVKYLAEHFSRLSQGLHYLNFQVPEEFNASQIKSIISSLHQKESKPDFSKVKIYAWRLSTGTYAPDSSDLAFLITLEPIKPPITRELSSVSFCEKVKNFASGYSKFKSISALHYVIAGIEKNEKRLEELIITDTDDNISECLISNIFWVAKGKYFTPSLSTGCIEGITRNVIIRRLRSLNIKIQEVVLKKEEMMEADHVFTTNAMGISHILGIENVKFARCLEIDQIYQPY